MHCRGMRWTENVRVRHGRSKSLIKTTREKKKKKREREKWQPTSATTTCVTLPFGDNKDDYDNFDDRYNPDDDDNKDDYDYKQQQWNKKKNADRWWR